MTPAIIIALFELANNITKIILITEESKPVEVRRAEAIMAWSILWAMAKPVLPDDLRKQIEGELAKVPEALK